MADTAMTTQGRANNSMVASAVTAVGVAVPVLQAYINAHPAVQGRAKVYVDRIVALADEPQPADRDIAKAKADEWMLTIRSLTSLLFPEGG